ncbi:hypothetical protein [Neptunomonas qingdaonensis]|uniref:Uncharacterized protein n=1 Tax=Neptunomonas qingdaonensis TaxID=1045558 RepID=A0A1I2LWQ9_9GAMM|nr:hypothetical protein [Neptunomonas qingdaonensis]SFF83633.1 hypothetical protein SAMN05216175_101291 [Neptunomonas qingdaonensis]
MPVVQFTCGFLSGLFFLAISFSLLSGGGGSFSGMVLQVLLAALGTGVGAFVAFRLQRSSAKQDVFRKEVIQGNRLLFALGYRVIELVNCKDASMIKDHRGYPNYVRYKPLVLVPLRSDFSDIVIPDRLIEGDPNTTINIQDIVACHHTCLALFEIHNKNHKKILQEMMSKLNVGVYGSASMKLVDVQLQKDSPKDYAELKDIADDLNRNLNNGISNSMKYFKKIRESLKYEYPEAKFVGFDFEALLNDKQLDLKE